LQKALAHLGLRRCLPAGKERGFRPRWLSENNIEELA
jgi:hypothetical protein